MAWTIKLPLIAHSNLLAAVSARGHSDLAIQSHLDVFHGPWSCLHFFNRPLSADGSTPARLAATLHHLRPDRLVRHLAEECSGHIGADDNPRILTLEVQDLPRLLFDAVFLRARFLMVFRGPFLRAVCVLGCADRIVAASRLRKSLKK